MNIALVGGAHIHTPGFIDRLNKRADEFTVAAVWDHDAARAAARAEKLGGAAVVADVAEIWADDSIAAVIVCSETNRHEPLVLAGAAARKHLFVEKPLGMGAADGFAMAKAIEDAGVLFQTGYFQRGGGIQQFLREQVAAGAFGTVTRARGSNCHSGSLKGWFDTDWRWMTDPSVAGVGAFGDLGTHSLDILMWILGDVEIATAEIGSVTGRYGDCDEYGEGLMRFACGAAGTLAAGWVDIDNPVTYLISGTEGHAAVCQGKLFFKSEHVDGADGKEPWMSLPAAQSAGLDLFLDTLLGKGEAPLVTAHEAAARSAVMEAMYQGAKARTWVDVAQG
jgi:predicted dehydrogenase